MSTAVASTITGSSANLVNGFAYNDPTRANWAFGRRALPKLVAESVAEDSSLRLQALHSLTDHLHDPLNAAEALKTQLVENVKCNLTNPNLWIRQRASELMYLIAESDAGITQILGKDCIPLLMALFDDTDAKVQTQALKAMLFITAQRQFARRAYAAYPALLEKLIPDSDPKDIDEAQSMIMAQRVQCLNQLLQGVGSTAVQHALKAEFLPRVTAWIAQNTGDDEFREALALTLATVCTHVCDVNLESTIAAPGNGAPLVAVLIRAIDDTLSRKARTASLRAIMALSIHVACKKEFVRAGTPEKLIPLLESTDCFTLMTSLACIASLSEDYPARYIFQTAVPQLEALKTHPDFNVAKAALSALKSVQWRP